MPDPGRYKDQKKFMEDCMHQTVKTEGKTQDQGIAQCLNMWRNEKGKDSVPPPPKKKKSASYILREAAKRIMNYA